MLRRGRAAKHFLIALGLIVLAVLVVVVLVTYEFLPWL